MASLNQTREIIARRISELVSQEVPFGYTDDDGVIKYINNLNELRTVIIGEGTTTVTGSMVDSNQSSVYYQENYQSFNELLATRITEWSNCYGSDTDGDGYMDDWNTESLLAGGNIIEVVSDGIAADGLRKLSHLVLNPGVACTHEIINITDILKSNLLSQFISFSGDVPVIDPIQADEVLNTDINELINPASNREQQIRDFFSMFQRLKGPTPGEDGYPAYDIDIDGDTVGDTFSEETAEEYENQHDWSPNNPDGFIPRTKEDGESLLQNSKISLEGIREDIDEYLKDKDAVINPNIQDERPLYEDVSEGYLQVRNMNQSIIVRRQEGTDIGIIGEDPDNPKYLEGFTVTMWVKFLDKVSNGTLFTFGNPLRENDPTGFSLKTEIIKQEDWISSGFNHPSDWFKDGDSERILKLVLHDGQYIRDNHIGIPPIDQSDELFNVSRKDTKPLNPQTYGNVITSGIYPFQYTRIPIDFEEWFFIVASYDPTILEDESFQASLNANDGNIPVAAGGPENERRLKAYWEGHWNPIIGQEGYVTRSGYGTQCRVEFISKSDFIRARGFRQE